MAEESSPPLAIYIHWPYCARICPYCDFNVYKTREDGDLIASIAKDLAYWREQSGARHIHSVHFGGGTPSLLAPFQIETLLKTVDHLWGLPAGTEIALEANPDDANSVKWQGYESAGLNRLSLGVQTFHDVGLTLLGRNHDSASGLHALRMARDIFPNISLDFIFGWKRQTLAMWELDLSTALDYAADHISAYQLTVESNTAFGKALERGNNLAVSEDQSADFFDATRARLTTADYEHYEVSNYAKAGKRSQHNMAYWKGYDYVGAGPGAHGRLTQLGKRLATVAEMRPNDYAFSVQAKGHGLAEQDTLSPEDWGDEYVIMGLRLMEGISLKRYLDISGKDLDQSRMEALAQMGLVDIKGDNLRASPEGRAVLNTVCHKLLGA